MVRTQYYINVINIVKTETDEKLKLRLRKRQRDRELVTVSHKGGEKYEKLAYSLELSSI